MIRADFHTHTRWSHDCFAGINEVLECARRRQLTALAITDHNQIEGAWRARDASRDMEVIVGCEVSLADHTHLIGLFLEQLPTSREPQAVIDEIHAQGGMVYVPHPFHPRSGLLRNLEGMAWLAQVDAIEVCSGYESDAHNRKTAAVATQSGLSALAGSDAHYGIDLGRACVEFPDCHGTVTLEVLRRADRKLYCPAHDLAGIHARDAAVRSETLPGLRRLAPAALRRLARRLNWSRFRRQIAAGCVPPVRREFAF